MNHALLRPTTQAQRAIHRALADLRCGLPILIEPEGTDPTTWLALPCDSATEATLAEFKAALCGTACLVLPATRATHLTGHPQPSAIAVAYPITQAQLHLPTLRTLPHPESHPVPTAPEAAHAAFTLAKRAGLLPDMLMAPCRTDLPPPDLLTLRARDIAAHTHPNALIQVAATTLPMPGGLMARITAFRPADGTTEHLAVQIGTPTAHQAPLARIHSECFTGDHLASLRCDCGPQLDAALAMMVTEGSGILLYMAQEGRGIGLVNKLRAYTLQDAGLDTLDANLALGFAGDERNFADAATMLKQLGLTTIRLLTNNPDKAAALQAHGIQVTHRLAHKMPANGINNHYLATKQHRFGHALG